jgi:alanine racemase
MYPSEEKVFGELDLRPAMTFKTRVTYIKEMEKDSAISYGKTYVTPSKKKIATIAIGYADGYSRLLSDKARVLVDGVICPQVGRICMDQCMIDVTNVNNINIGDEVTLFGGEIPVEDIAAKMGTINYEVVCMVGNRIPRVYIKDEKIVDEKNSLLS